MKNQDVLTKSLAVVGTVLVWIPILAPILFSVALLITEEVWRFDYLMPAELFLLAMIGGNLLVLGPCCGGNATDVPPQSQFDYRVIRDCTGKFLVSDLPVSVP